MQSYHAAPTPATQVRPPRTTAPRERANENDNTRKKVKQELNPTSQQKAHSSSPCPPQPSPEAACSRPTLAPAHRHSPPSPRRRTGSCADNLDEPRKPDPLHGFEPDGDRDRERTNCCCCRCCRYSPHCSCWPRGCAPAPRTARRRGPARARRLRARLWYHWRCLGLLSSWRAGRLG
jgi:hypothetical protein